MQRNLKKEIIEKSFILFKEHGYDAVTLTQICETCEITKTTFYRYLSSKEEILTYFFASIKDELSDLAVELINTTNHFEQLINVFNLIFKKMELLGKDLYSQLYITNIKKYSGSFDEIDSFKKLAINILNKAQTTNQFKNKTSPINLYEYISNCMFGCGVKWCLGLTTSPKNDFTIMLQDLLEVEDSFKLL